MNIGRNTVWNIAEVVLGTLTQFAIFRLIISGLDVAALGVWSLVFSALSFARIADVGLAAGLVRFVARKESNGTALRAVDYIETALLTTLGLYLVLGAVIYWPTFYALSMALHGFPLAEARTLLPYAVIAFIMLNVTGVTSSALVGLGRSDVKSSLSVASFFIQFVVSYFALRSYGLKGLAFATIVQNIFVAVVGWITVLQIGEPGGLRFPWRFKFNALKEMFTFGLSLQALAIVNFLYDPVVKFMLSAIAGPAAVGLYETAYRLVIQARAIIIAPTQNLTPLFASVAADTKAKVREIYMSSTALMMLAAAAASVFLILASPLASLILLKSVQPTYVVWVTILCLGWGANIVSAPAYVMGIGTGRVRWNIIGSAINTLLAATLGYGLGRMFGAVGAVIGVSLAIGLGGIITMVGNCHAQDIKVSVPTIDDIAKSVARVARSIRTLAVP